MSTCGGCGAEILWVKTATTGSAMPLDMAPTATGNVYLDASGTAHVGRCRCPAAHPPQSLRHVPHHATCPKAADFRRRGQYGLTS
jgi:hypothetical protein